MFRLLACIDASQHAVIATDGLARVAPEPYNKHIRTRRRT